MPLGPFLKRELITSVRPADAFYNRVGAAALATAIVAGCVVAWDWWGWDRTSVAGAASFSLSAFGLILAVQVVLALGVVPGEIAPKIASERDRKSLDVLLATQFSGAEIVLGTMAAGLVQYATGLAAVLPVVVLIVFLGGVDARLVLLAGAGLAATAFALAALSVAVSVGAHGPTGPLGLDHAGDDLDVPAHLGRVARSPALAGRRGVGGANRPLAPRQQPLRGGGESRRHGPTRLSRGRGAPDDRARDGRRRGADPLGGLAAAAGLARLVDREGRSVFLRSLRTRRQPRPACGDDPVLWNEIHSLRGLSAVEHFVGRLVNLVWIALLSLATSWFAVPAFWELAERGYVAAPEGLTMPELNPFARVVASKLLKLSLGPAPGQARLEFNIVLRQSSAVFVTMYILMIVAAAAESVAAERERDTWLGLIATPLTGREILRAKLLGAVWRARGMVLVMMGLWTVGLLVGAVHPLGYLAALAGMAVSGGFFAALGAYVSLWSCTRAQAMQRVILPTMVLLMSGLAPLILPPGSARILLGAVSMPFLAWSSLLSYEDVHAAIHSGAFPQLTTTGLQTGEGAGVILAAWLIGTTAQAVGAFTLTRAAFRGFDAAVGRPRRSRGDPRRS